MTFDQIDFFITAVRSNTFFDAAEALHTTQSTLSKQIIKLEKELNVKLFDRSSRSAVLTPAGEQFYSEALKLSSQYHQMLNAMESFAESPASQLKIGSLPILSQYGFTALIHKFEQKYPEIELILSEVEESDLMKGLEHNRFQLGFVREAMLNPDDYSFIPLAEDRLMVLLPAGHPSEHQKALSLADIAGEDFILMNPYTSIYQMCMGMFRNADITPRILRTARTESIISAVEIGEGISILAEGSLRLFRHQQTAAIPLAGSPALFIGIACKKEKKPSAAANTFLAFVRQHSSVPAR